MLQQLRCSSVMRGMSQAGCGHARRNQSIHIRGDERGGLSPAAGVEKRTPPTIANWTSRGRNTIPEQPRPFQVHHNGAWYRADLTELRREPNTGWWGRRIRRRRRDDALAPGNRVRATAGRLGSYRQPTDPAGCRSGACGRRDSRVTARSSTSLRRYCETARLPQVPRTHAWLAWHI
jgi:hypothetical protein